MTFGVESEMVRPVTEWLVAKDLAIKREFLTPWGFCDLVALAFRKRNVLKRLKLGQVEAIGPPTRVALYQRLPSAQSGKSVTFRRLRREFAELLTGAELEQELTTLIDRHLVGSNRNGMFQRIDGWVPLQRRVVAVELKLRRVEDALAQASSHVRFADESYVALPAPLANRVVRDARLARFRERGVGVLAVTPGSCRVVSRAARNQDRVDHILQMHCTERFWRTRPKGK